jgi:hypothetical protein
MSGKPRPPAPSMRDMRSWLIAEHNKAVIRAQKSVAANKSANKNNRASRELQARRDMREVWLLRGLLDLVDVLTPPNEIDNDTTPEMPA